MALNVAVVVGNPRPRSRTLEVARTLANQLMEADAYELTVIDLVDFRDAIFVDSDALALVNAQVARSELVIFASPTYKATYSGLLKAFLDRYPANGLAGVVAIPVLTGADEAHSMGPTHTLAPLLAELGAIVPGRGFYFVSNQMDRLEEQVRSAAQVYRGNFARVAKIAAHARLQ